MSANPAGTSVAPQKPGSLSGLSEMFRRGSSLIDAAATALADVGPVIARIDAVLRQPGSLDRARIAAEIASLGDAIAHGRVGGDNLLLLPRQGSAVRPLVIFSLARQGSGAVDVQSIELDRASIALGALDVRASDLPYDQLRALGRSAAFADDARRALTTAVDALRARTHLANSRLSIAKSRLDLQSSFLDAVTQADAASPVVRLESHLNVDSARDMALATRRLLGRESLNIANGNRKTLQALVSQHVTDA